MRPSAQFFLSNILAKARGRAGTRRTHVTNCPMRAAKLPTFYLFVSFCAFRDVSITQQWIQNCASMLKIRASASCTIGDP